MGYYNPIYRYGAEAFARDAVAAGRRRRDRRRSAARGGCRAGRAGARRRSRHRPPRDADQRRSRACRRSSRMPAALSITSRSPASPARARPRRRACADAVARLRRFTELPVAVGFGIRTPAQAAEVARAADAAVVGTALVDRLALNLDPDGNAKPGLVEAVLADVRGAGGRGAQRASGMNWLTNYVLPKIRVFRAQGGAGQSLAQMPVVRADAVSSRAGGKPAGLPQLRPSFPRSAARPGSSCCSTSGEFAADRDAEGRARSAALSRPQALHRPAARKPGRARGRPEPPMTRSRSPRGGSAASPAVVAAFDFAFMGGSMGVAVGEALRRGGAARGRARGGADRRTGLGRRADAGGHPVADADAAHDPCRRHGQGSGAALHRRADRSDDRRRVGLVRDARRHHPGRARRDHRVRRRAGHPGNDPREAARAVPARRVPA